MNITVIFKRHIKIILNYNLIESINFLQNNFKGQEMAKILIVDDASLIRTVADRAAREAGFDTVLACDGLEAIEMLKDHKIDLIFSDINMPRMGGLEMVTIIKQDPGYKFIPVVMLTTEAGDDLKAQGKALGVKAWLVKPFNKEKFLLALEKLLG